VPDDVVRAIVRRRVAAQWEHARARGAFTPEARAAFLRRRTGSPASPEALPALPAAFFRPWLGPRMKYSTALWSTGAADLAAAEEAMLALTGERAALDDGQSILDLGCGWGPLALWIAERHPGSRVTALTDEPAHAGFIPAEARARGLQPPRVVRADARDFVPEAPFDRIVIVEMLESLPDWPALLSRVRGWLAPGGSLFVHALACRDYAYDEASGPAEAWLSRHAFLGGLRTGDDLAAGGAGDFVEEARWIVPGEDVARTAQAWRARLDAAAPQLRAELARAGTPGASGALRRWRLLLLACGELFSHEAWHVVHARLRPAPR